MGCGWQVWLRTLCVQSEPACWACREQIEVSRAVQELPRAEVRTSTSLKSVPKIKPRKSVFAVQSQDRAEACR